MTALLPVRRTRRRLLASLALGAALTGGGVLAAATPAVAADSWRTISSTTKCYSYSYGRTCTVERTQLRQVSYCTNPPFRSPYSQAGWASYCIRYTSTTTWV